MKPNLPISEIDVKKSNGELAHSAALFQLVFETSLDGLILIHGSGLIHTINSYAEQLTGYRGAELAGQHLRILLPEIPDLSLLGTDDFPESPGAEWFLKRKNGSVFCLNARLKKAIIGEDRMILVTLSDKFKEKIKADLSDSEERWHALTSSSPDFIIVADEYLNVEFVNRAAPTITTEINSNHSILNYIPGENKEEALGLLLDVLRTGVPRYLYTQYATSDFGQVYYETLVAPRKSGDRTTGLILNSRDITKREKQSLELYESKQQLRNILDGMPVFIGVLSVEGIILDINQATLNVLGMTLEETIGTWVPDLYCFSYSQEVRNKCMEGLIATARGEITRYDMKAKIVDDQFILVHLAISPLYNIKGEIVKLIISAIDITQRELAEEALQLTSKNLTMAVKAGGVGLWSWDLLTNEVFYSPEWKAQIGFDKNEIENSFKEWEDRLHPEDREATLSIVKNSMESPWPILRNEFRLLHKDGTYRWILAQGSIEFDDANLPRTMHGTHVDITERKAVELALQEKEKRLKKAHQIANLGYWKWNMVTGDFIWSEEAKYIFGYLDTMGEPNAQLFLSFIHEDDRIRMQSYIQEVMEKKPVMDVEYRIRRGDGQVRYLFTRSEPVHNKRGEMTGITGTLLDVTERKQVEDALRNSESRYKALVNNSPDLILTVDRDNIIRFVNRVEKGITIDEVVGKSLFSFIPPDFYSAVSSAIDRCFSTKHIQGYETRGTAPHFDSHWYQTRVVPILNEVEEVIGITLIATDITDLKKSQSLLSVNEERLRQAVRVSRIGIFDHDHLTEMIYWSPEQRTIYGWDAGEKVELSKYLSHVHPEDKARVIEAVKRAHDPLGDGLFDITHRIIDRKGVVRWLYMRSTTYFEGEGANRHPVRTIGAVEDITDRKVAQLLLEESESRFRSLYELSPVGISLNDFKTGAYLDFNDALIRPTGYSREEFLKLTYWDVTPKEYAREEKEQLRSLQETGYYGPYEKEYICKDGRRYPILLSGVRLVDAQGRELIWSVIQDIGERKKMENALVETNEKLTQIEQFISVTTDAIQVADEEGRLIYLNNVAAERLGIPKEVTTEYFVSDFEDIFRDKGSWKKHIELLKSTEHVQTEGINKNQKTGNTFPVEVTVRYVTIQEKGYVIAVSRDITERKNAEAALIKSERTLRKAQKVAKIGSWTIDENYVIEWSEEAYNIFDTPYGTPLTHAVFLSLVHPEDKDYVDAAWRSAMDGAPYDIIHRIIVNGKVKWLREQAELIHKNGQFSSAFGTVQDITTQRVLQEVNVVFDQAQQFAGTGSWRWSIQSGEFFWSNSVFSLLGYSQETSVTYENFVQAIYPEDRPLAEGAFQRGLESKMPYEVEYRVKHGSDGLRWIAVKGNFAFDKSGSPTEMYGILHDITPEKISKEELILARRKAEEAASIKDEFLSVMSHEIRTPLNSVIGLSNLLLKKQPREDQLPLLYTLKKSSDNLWSLINDVLDFNKIQTGNVELEELTFNVTELLRQIQSSHYPLALDKGLELRVTIDPNVPKILTGDVLRLTQILNNLVNNAIKFTSSGYIRLSVHLASRTADHCTVRFEVIDSGIGLTKTQLDRLFIPFQQADKDITRKFGGTGLGLSIVKGLVKLMQGEIVVTSKPDKGSTFSIQLSFAAPKIKRAQKAEKNLMPVEEASLKGFSILYVEDVESNQLVVQEVLHDLGARCELAESGNHALKCCLQQKFDVILMDLHMPEMDGYEATKRILSQKNGLNKDTPVVAFTADTMSDKLKKKTSGAGIKSIINKPFTNEQLVERIKEVCHTPSPTLPAIERILVMDFYESIFNHDTEKLKKLKKVIDHDLMKFEKDFLLYDQKLQFSKMREEIHKILPIAKNLKCKELKNLMEEYRRHKTYNKQVKPLRVAFIALMKKIRNELRTYHY